MMCQWWIHFPKSKYEALKLSFEEDKNLTLHGLNVSLWFRYHKKQLYVPDSYTSLAPGYEPCIRLDNI